MSQPDSPTPRSTPDENADPAGADAPRPAGATRPQEGSAPTQGEKLDEKQVQSAVTELASAELDTTDRKRLLERIAATAGGSRRGLRRFILGPGAAVRWVLDTLIDIAPHLPIRDLETLSKHHDGKTGEELADALVRNASRATAGIGAAGGGVAAIEWAAPPALLSAPVLIGAETVAVVAVEVKLIGELHEVYGVPVPGPPTERATQLLDAWAQRRGVNWLSPARGFTTVLGLGMRKELRDRLLKRMGRNLTTLGPLLTGAAVAAELNRRATKILGSMVRDDLRATAGKQRALPPGG